MKEKEKCENRIDKELENTLKDIRILWEAYCSGEEDVEDLGNVYDYGLCFDYVSPNTFTDQEQGFFRWQLSTGGPEDEFRFYANPDLSCYCVEYVFLDWFDGAERELIGEDKSLLMEIYGWFRECGSVEAELEKAND